MKRPIIRTENLVYAALWLLLAVLPVATEWSQVLTDHVDSFSWEDVWGVWRRLLPFALLFLVHNALLAPLLMYRGKRGLYFLSVTTMVIVFTLFQCHQRPHHPHDFDAHHRHPAAEMLADRPAHPTCDCTTHSITTKDRTISDGTTDARPCCWDSTMW